MMKYTEALDWLYTQKKLHKRENLSRIKHCIELLNIKTNYQIIHIAGTNGKGSVASSLNAILKKMGKRVGMFVSPYVISFNERIQVNAAYITDEEVIHYIERLQGFSKEYFEKYQDTIPFFELTFLMALLYFEQKSIDVLILECGLGGRLDPTNVLDKDAAVITNIGYDHMKELGPTLFDIAEHKLGITRKNIPCFTCVDEEILPYFQTYAIANEFPLFYPKKDVSNIQVFEDKTCFTYRNVEYQVSLRGVFQAYNVSLALAVIQTLYPKTEETLLNQALMEVTWPGRFERVQSNIILDGAHNLPGIEALVETLKTAYPNRKIKVVFTALRDKMISDMLSTLDAVTERYYFTTIQDSRASELESFTTLTSKPYQLFSSYQEAICRARNELKEEELLIITGSLHFISEARKYLMEKE